MAQDQLASIKSNFEGKWKLERSENFDEFLKEMGVGMMKRTMAGKASPTCEISVDGDVISISMNAGIKTQSEKFKLGEEFETEALDAKGKVVVTFEDGRFVMTPSSANKAKLPKTTRYIVGTEMCMEMHVGDVVCKRFFKRV